MHILLKHILSNKFIIKEDPDRVKGLDPEFGVSPIAGFEDDDTYAFFTFPKYNLIARRTFHGNIMQSMAKIYDAMIDLDLKDKDNMAVMVSFIEKLFKNRNTQCSNINEFVKDLQPNGIVYNFIQDKGDGWFIAHIDDFRSLPDCLCGRVWTNKKIISFWNELSDIKKNWHEVRELFLSFPSIFGNLDDYKIDNIERDAEYQKGKELPELLPASEIQKHHTTPNLTPEEIRALRKKLHMMSPEEKKKAMHILGMDTPNKAALDATKLNMTPAQLNYLKGVVAEMKYKDFFSDILNESMTAAVSGADYESRHLEDMLGLSMKLGSIIIHEIINKLPADEIEHFRNNRNMELFAVDGNGYNKPTGVINFYTSGLKDDTIKKIIEAVKYYASELNLMLGSIKGPEQSNMFKSQVIRIPVVKNLNIEKKKEHPPEIQMSNSNARLIFKRLLGFGDFDEGYTIAAIDLLKKIEDILEKAKDDEFLYRFAAPEKIDKGQGIATMITGEVSPQYLLMRLNELKKLCEYAINNGHRNISIA